MFDIVRVFVEDTVAPVAEVVNVNPDTVFELTVLLLVGFVMGPSSVVLPISTVVEVEPAVPPLAFKVMVYLTGITQRTEAP